MMSDFFNKKYFDKGYITVQDLVDYCNSQDINLDETRLNGFNTAIGYYESADILETDTLNIFIGDSDVFGKN